MPSHLAALKYAQNENGCIEINLGTGIGYSMCLPFIMDKAERFSTKILNNMPSGVVVVNEDLEVQQLNRTAMRMLNISHESDVLGDSVVRVLDTAPFFTCLETGKSVKKLRGYSPWETARR